MNWDEYVSLSEKTLSTEFYVTAQATKNLLHGAIGLCTEAGEMLHFANQVREGTKIDIVNLEEELGDLLWYLAIFDRDIPEYREERKSVFVGEVSMEQIPVFFEGLSITTSEILDLLKKNIFYGKDIDLEKLATFIAQIQGQIDTICMTFKLSGPDIREKNINKLKARYGEKFSEEAAINRDLGKERKTLES